MLCVFPCFCYFFLYLICFYLLLIIFIYLFFLFLFAFSAFGLFLFVLFSFVGTFIVLLFCFLCFCFPFTCVCVIILLVWFFFYHFSWVLFFCLLFSFCSCCSFLSFLSVLAFAFLLVFFHSIFKKFFATPCSLQVLCFPARDQAWVPVVGMLNPRCWTTKEIPEPGNINWWEFSQWSPSWHKVPAPQNCLQVSVLDTWCQTTGNPSVDRKSKVTLSSQTP